ncbi:DMT family transporter [Marinovum sp. 2_MG-2023]|uniref:DMT family transporter n=1 Tax=unclassified Marinovum TaxID=2647166 RepID=UPI0026E29112|nr:MULTISPECIES: DMT family transporter [unclassified Marinovum]MDO6731536.1 DMT family transporter [Marinovum sp. 2_MG-2023]MDO6780896.1 DMT family transporter [Marinovum sp. 1_MG-2023]
MNRPPPPTMDLKASMMLLLLAAVWGGSFFFAEVALTELPPMTITLHRVFWAMTALACALRARGARLPRPGRIWGAYLVMGALNNAIPFSLIFWGQTQIDSGLASILNATTAMFAALMAGLLLKDEPLTFKRIAGATLGVVGVALIMGPSAVTAFSLHNLAQLAVLGATMSYALAGVWGRSMLSDQPPLVNAFGMLLGSTVLMIPAVLVLDGPPNLSLSMGVWAALLGLSTLSTALAYGLYFAILARAGAANLLLVTLLIPPFAIALGVVFLGETMAPIAWFGFAVIGIGFAVTDGRLFARFARSGRRGAKKDLRKAPGNP